MSDKRGIDEGTIYNVSAMDWLLALSEPSELSE